MSALEGRINDFDVTVLHEFVQGLAQSAGISLHVDLIRGVNLHTSPRPPSRPWTGHPRRADGGRARRALHQGGALMLRDGRDASPMSGCLMRRSRCRRCFTEAAA